LTHPEEPFPVSPDQSPNDSDGNNDNDSDSDLIRENLITAVKSIEQIEDEEASVASALSQETITNEEEIQVEETSRDINNIETPLADGSIPMSINEEEEDLDIEVISELDQEDFQEIENSLPAIIEQSKIKEIELIEDNSVDLWDGNNVHNHEQDEIIEASEQNNEEELDCATDSPFPQLIAADADCVDEPTGNVTDTSNIQPLVDTGVEEEIQRQEPPLSPIDTQINTETESDSIVLADDEDDSSVPNSTTSPSPLVSHIMDNDDSSVPPPPPIIPSTNSPHLQTSNLELPLAVDEGEESDNSYYLFDKTPKIRAPSKTHDHRFHAYHNKPPIGRDFRFPENFIVENAPSSSNLSDDVSIHTSSSTSTLPFHHSSAVLRQKPELLMDSFYTSHSPMVRLDIGKCMVYIITNITLIYGDFECE
jgi:hypothetical protein